MKRQSLLLSLIILVTLFLHVMPLAATYAYFTDSVRVSGAIKLKTGTVALAPFEAQSITVKEANQVKTITTAIRNTGTLAAKITLKELVIQENNQVINHVSDYFELTTNIPTEKLGPGETTTFTVKLTKKAQWLNTTPVTVAFKLRLSQVGLSDDDRGFIDEQTFLLTINNESEVVPPIVDWPEDKYFTGSFYVKQNAYYSVVDNQLTTVIPGEIYVKAGNLTPSQIAEAKENIQLLRGQSENYTFKISYIGNKGFKLSEISLTGRSSTNDSLSTTFSGTNSMNINFKDGGKLAIWDHSIDAFAQPFLLSVDKKDAQSALIQPSIEVPKMGTILELQFLIHNNQAVVRWSSLTSDERTYLKTNISLTLTATQHYQANFKADYSGLNIWRGSGTANHYANLELKRNNQVVFRRSLAPVKETFANVFSLDPATLDSSTINVTVEPEKSSTISIPASEAQATNDSERTLPETSTTDSSLEEMQAEEQTFSQTDLKE